MQVIALHGQGGTPEMLREDMGDPPWVDYYLGWRRFPGRRYLLDRPIHPQEPVVWVGYSLGCDVARYMGCVYSAQTIGYILYEGPCFAEPCGEDPAVVIFNRDSRRSQRRRGGLTRPAHESLERWGKSRRMTVRFADGRHVAVKDGRLAHGWDQSQNGFLAEWIAKLDADTKRV